MQVRTTPPKGALSVSLLTLISAFSLAACDGGGGSSASPQSSSGSAQRGVDRPPTISGSPVSAIVYDRTYTFVPTATGPGTKRLSFTIANKPAWASFDSSTGMLEGTPRPSDVGAYTNITISVTDGLYVVALPSFRVDVVGTASGSVAVNWLPPTQRDDGSPLTDLAGYNLRWGTALGHYPNVATIPNAGVAAFVIDQLGAGTYYLVATAYDSSGTESDLSNVATTTIL